MKNISKTINTKKSGTTSQSQSRINPLLLFNISMYTLAAICFMVYTTELTYVHAEGEEDLGSASSSLDASVTVGTACNFSGNVDIPHTSTIMNGINSTDIGKTTMNVTCNDEGGYAVYAIGYTNDEYGNTALQSSISDDYNISTGTSTSGNTSNWSMKLATVSGTTTATIENGYDNYNTVPDDYTKVATLNTITNTGTSTTGSSISTTYQTYISPTQPAGAYTGKVKYTLVHPSTAPAPEKPVTIADAYKASGATKTSQGYYKMQDMNSGINSSVNIIGDSMQVQDIRDNKIYWITKMKDGNIWMTQNLDLDLNNQTVLTPEDTNISANWTPANSTISFTGTSVSGWSNNDNVPYSADPGELYIYSSGSTDNDEQYTSLAACQAAHPVCSTHNHAGNYYNWSASIASNSTSAMIVQDSICPAGWRLPTARNKADTAAGREWNALLVAEGIMTDNPGYSYAENGFNNIRTSPLWLARSGRISSGSLSGIGENGNYWPSTINSSNAYYFSFGRTYIHPAVMIGKSGGYSVRCLVK